MKGRGRGYKYHDSQWSKRLEDANDHAHRPNHFGPDIRLVELYQRNARDDDKKYCTGDDERPRSFLLCG